MKLFKTTILGSAFAALAGTTAMAGCGIPAGNVSIIGNDFPAIQAIVAAATACAGDGVTISANLTKDHETLNAPGMTTNPAQYSVAVVANSSIVALMNDGLIRPLDDLIAEYAPDLPGVNKVTVDGKVMAVAFMANAQHLFYRSDILEQAGVAVPTTYEEVLAAAEAIKAQGIMEYPFAMNTQAGWNLAEEFVNMYLGMGGELFEPGTANATINNEKGVAALNMMKALTAYSNPDFLTYDSNATQALWESGGLAMSTMWGSRGGAILDDEGSTRSGDRDHGSCRRTHRWGRVDPGLDPVVGRVHHCRQHVGRGRGGQLPGADERADRRRGDRQPRCRSLVERGLCARSGLGRGGGDGAGRDQALSDAALCRADAHGAGRQPGRIPARHRKRRSRRWRMRGGL